MKGITLKALQELSELERERFLDILDASSVPTLLIKRVRQARSGKGGAREVARSYVAAISEFGVRAVIPDRMFREFCQWLRSGQSRSSVADLHLVALANMVMTGPLHRHAPLRGGADFDAFVQDVDRVDGWSVGLLEMLLPTFNGFAVEVYGSLYPHPHERLPEVDSFQVSIGILQRIAGRFEVAWGAELRVAQERFEAWRSGRAPWSEVRRSVEAGWPTPTRDDAEVQDALTRAVFG